MNSFIMPKTFSAYPAPSRLSRPYPSFASFGPPMNETHELESLLDCRQPLILLESREEKRLLEMIERFITLRGRALWLWSITHGLRPHVTNQAAYATERLADALRHIEKAAGGGLFVFVDAHPFLEDPLVVRAIKNLALGAEASGRTLIFLSAQLSLPRELEGLATRFVPGLPDRQRLLQILNEEARSWRDDGRPAVRASREALELLVQHLGGLSEEQARRLARMAIRDDGAVTLADIGQVLKAKHEAMEGSEMLMLEPPLDAQERLGGLPNFRHWLEVRRPAFISPADDLPPPKGVLLLGVQGSGKSLAAKTVAADWHLPLFRLDFGALYGKYHGESEENLRRVLNLAGAMAPCVLWMDEIEKGIANDGSGEADGGTSQRLLGTLLTWMAERQARVFLVATANDVSRLPPELLRKGRFDEIFFVDLPDAATRAEILQLHLGRRLEAQALADWDLADLARRADGFSGAEIAQAVVSATYEARAAGRSITAADVVGELGRTRPLSVVMAERVQALRNWAAGRTVPA